PLRLVARPDARLDVAAQGLERTGRDHALRRATDTQQQVHAGLRHRRHERAGHVAVGDELDARAGLADLLDDFLVARTVENDHGYILNSQPGRLGHALNVLLHRPLDVDRV